MSANLISRKHHNNHCTMIFDDLDFLSPMYTFVSFLNNAYFIFILVFIPLLTFLEKLHTFIGVGDLVRLVLKVGRCVSG